MRGQEEGQRSRGRDPHRSGGAGRERPRLLLHAIRHGVESGGAGPDALTGVGEFDAVRNPLDQRQGQRLFQYLEAAPDSGLADAERACAAALREPASATARKMRRSSQFGPLKRPSIL